eukprot:CAMPEP_0178440584 /NCGR_PEP_ID=MMETSP0689_2-20121128/36875_1 /TAXON_ID=160604 /ORGANISM="Amphidinium massartii, Strain CS-259" /LENGTH=742 /DNA_ID=CAMNT_0020063405 /DNA_START=29 /DNA_END=2257 /DNA_ORIENTATION=-
MDPSLNRLNVVTQHVLAANPTAAADEVAKYETGEHSGCLPSYEHPIHFPASGLLSEKAAPSMTLSSLLAKAAANFPKQVALTVERPLPKPVEPGVAPALPWAQWKKWTWAEYYQQARYAAQAYMVLGVEQFGTVSIFGFNAPEWVISALAAVLCGGKYSGIYLTDTPDQVNYKVVHSASAVAVVDSQVEFDSVASQIDKAPCLKAIVAWGMPSPADIKRSDGSVCKAFTWDGILEFGKTQGSPEALDQRMAAQRPGHACGIIYTSGTTGNPKGVMIHHDALCAQGAIGSEPGNGFMDCFEDGGEGRLLSYLPLSHIAGGLMDFLNPLYMAGHMKLSFAAYFARPYDLKEMTLAQRIQFVRPTAFLAVPRVYEKIQARMMAVSATITGVKKSIATWAKGKGLEYSRNLQPGASQSKPFLHGLADKLILSKAREALGLDKCRCFITGAAPISIETLEYFGALGMRIQNCYGMSESSGITTLCSAVSNAFGTVGFAPPGIEVKCFQIGPNGEKTEVPRCQAGEKVVPEAMQGEICFRGRHIMMGYLANPEFGEEHIKEITEKNRGTIDSEGWLHSGDKGCIDTAGFLRITGRYKELIIGAGGENIAPVPVEENLKLVCPALSNVMMVGDQRRYNVCVVTLLADGATGEFPGNDNLTGAALAVNPKVTKVSEAMKDPVWRDYIQAGIDKTNSNPAVCQNNAWKIQKFAILPRDFSIQNGEFTATLKLKRSVAEQMWLEVIDAMYVD